MEGVRYEHRSVCEVPLGTGGAIFTKNTVLEISDSIFDHNNAFIKVELLEPFQIMVNILHINQKLH